MSPKPKTTRVWQFPWHIKEHAARVFLPQLEVGCAHGPGGDNDPGLTQAETRAHFGAWCIVSSPLVLSHDVNNDTIMDAVWEV